MDLWSEGAAEADDETSHTRGGHAPLSSTLRMAPPPHGGGGAVPPGGNGSRRRAPEEAPGEIAVANDPGTEATRRAGEGHDDDAVVVVAVVAAETTAPPGPGRLAVGHHGRTGDTGTSDDRGTPFQCDAFLLPQRPEVDHGCDEDPRQHSENCNVAAVALEPFETNGNPTAAAAAASDRSAVTARDVTVADGTPTVEVDVRQGRSQTAVDDALAVAVRPGQLDSTASVSVGGAASDHGTNQRLDSLPSISQQGTQQQHQQQQQHALINKNPDESPPPSSSTPETHHHHHHQGTPPLSVPQPRPLVSTTTTTTKGDDPTLPATPLERPGQPASRIASRHGSSGPTRGRDQTATAPAKQQPPLPPPPPATAATSRATPAEVAAPSNVRKKYTFQSKRGSYAERTLGQLEEATRDWYTSQQEEQREQRAKLRHGSRPAPAKTVPVNLFTLQFNEASVTALARWIAGGGPRKPTTRMAAPPYSSTTTNNNSHDDPHRNHTTTTTTVMLAAVDARYRQCSLCHAYGHYEVECPSLPREHVRQLGRTFGTGGKTTVAPQPSRRRNGDVTHPTKRSRPRVGLRDDQRYRVTVEECDGYLIEQRSAPERKTKRNNGRRERSSTNQDDDTVASTMELDGCFIRAGTSAESLTVGNTDVVVEEEGPPTIDPGRLVAWYAERNTDWAGDDTTVRGDVCVGMVQEMEEEANRALVHVFRAVERHSGLVPESTDHEKVETTAPRLPEDPCVWVHHDDLHLVVETNRALPPVVWNGKPKVRFARSDQRRPGNVYTKRYKERINANDMSMRPRRQPLRCTDGTFQLPKGRPPCGLVWDSVRGVWIPFVTDTQPET